MSTVRAGATAATPKPLQKGRYRPRCSQLNPFPATLAVVGPKEFDELARGYLVWRPPTKPWIFYAGRAIWLSFSATTVLLSVGRSLPSWPGSKEQLWRLSTRQTLLT